MSDLVVMQGGQEHVELRERVTELRKRVEESYWDLSQALSEIYHGSYYVAWGFASWKEYVEADLEFALRKAQYLVSIQDWFGKMRPDVQAWAKELGWTKAKELVGIVTEDNASTWQQRLQGLSYAQMTDALKGGSDGGGDGLGGLKPLDGPADNGATEKPERKAFALFPDQSANVAAALEKAKKLANTEKDGHALDLICSDFLATNAASDDFFSVVRRLEKSSGMRIVVYDQTEDVVIYGGDLLDELSGDDEDDD